DVGVGPAGLGFERGEDLRGALAAVGDQLGLAVLVLRVEQVRDGRRGADAQREQVGARLYGGALRVGVARVGEGALALDDPGVEGRAACGAPARPGRDVGGHLRAGPGGGAVVRRRAVLALVPLAALVAAVAEAAGDDQERDEHGEAVAATLLLELA